MQQEHDPDAPRAPTITAEDALLHFDTMTATDVVRRHRAVSHQARLDHPFSLSTLRIPRRLTRQTESGVCDAEEREDAAVPRPCRDAPTDGGAAGPHTHGRHGRIPPAESGFGRPLCFRDRARCAQGVSLLGSIGCVPFLIAGFFFLSSRKVKQQDRTLLDAKQWWNGVRPEMRVDAALEDGPIAFAPQS